MRFIAGLLATLLLALPVYAGLVDPAPIQDEVIDQIVTQPLQGSHSTLAVSMRQYLENLSLALEDMDDQSSSLLAPVADVSFVSAMLPALDHLRNEARKQLADDRARLAELGLKDHVKSLDQLASQVEDRFGRLGKLQADISQAHGRFAQRAAIGKARSTLRDMLRAAEQTAPVSTGPISTYSYDTPLKPKSQTPAMKLPAYIAGAEPGGDPVGQDGGLLQPAGTPPVTPSEASQCGYTSADMAKDSTAQPEVRVTAEITAKADSLSYSPAKIFKWVYENVEYEPYYGSLKGAQATLLAKAGNDTDQASLLIALLRASNIPARYVRGQVEILDSTSAGANARVAKWLGAESYQAAATILAQGRNPNAFYYSSGKYGVSFVHIWVEACVPYGHYRGARIDNTGHRWIPMDPSFKDKSYQSGITTNVNFDYAGYLAKRTNGPDSLPHEAYAKQVKASVRASNPNNTLEDVPYRGRINPLRLDILPSSLPYDVTQFLSWSGTASAEAASLPDGHRYKLKLNVYNSAGGSLAATTLQMPEHVLKRITLSPKGATSADQTALDTWRNDGNVNSAIPTTINAFPVVKSDGTDIVTGTASVKLNSVNNQLRMQVILPELASGDCTSAPVSSACLNHVLYTNIGMANYHALQAYAFQASDSHLATRATRLLNTVKGTSSPNANLEETEGEFLNIVSLKYMRYITDAARFIGGLDGGSGESGNHLGLASSQMKVAYVFDLPFAIDRSGFLVDMPGGKSRNVDLSTGGLVYKTFLLSGYAGSAYESYVWQENSRLDAVSTVRGIQYARETGISVLTVTSANWATESPKFTANANTALNYSTAEVSTIKASFVDKGYTLTIPRSLIQYSNWKGSVYVAEKNALPTSASAAFIIAGTYAGGYTVGDQIAYTYSFPLNTGYQVGSTTASAANPGGVPPIVIGGSLGNGVNLYNTVSGDPVNLVTGNVYHTERDLSIMSRGGLPIVFERSYNSRAASLSGAASTPLGYGWTHSFNHYLRFHGVEGSAAKVSWVDGTGNEKFFSTTSHASGNITLGATLANPAGIFVTLRRETNGQYTIREKNGLIYTFESITAGATNAGLKAKLLSIKDRNGNTLTLAYTGNNLTTVKDGLNRGLVLTYDASNRISQIKEAGLPAAWAVRTWKYVYDSSGNLSQFHNPEAVVSPSTQPPVIYTYYGSADGANRNHALKSYLLPRGNGMSFEYYTNGRAFRHKNTLGETTTFTYNDFRRETVQINERGLERRFFFDAWGNPLKIVEENGAEREYAYDAANVYNRLSKTDPLGYKTSYSYDSKGNVTKITSPRASTQTFDNFDAFGQPQRIKDDRGNYSVRKYDAKGNLLEEIALKAGGVPAIPYTPSAAQVAAWTIHTYDAYGNRKTTKRVRDFATQAGPVITYTYDVSSLFPTKITRQGDKTGDGVLDVADAKTLVHDEIGRPETGIDADWQTRTYSYDRLDRVITGTDTVGQSRSYVYDKNGNLSENKLIVAGVQVDRTTYAYDNSDRRTSETRYGKGTAGAAFKTAYDTRGNPIKLTDADGFTLSFDYDAADHPIRAFDEEGNHVYTWRDVDGKPKCSVDPNGNVTWYSYWDATRNGLLKRQTAPATGTCPGTAPTTVRATEYDYDANGNVISTTQIASDGSASRTSFTSYDELNRPVQATGPQYNDASLGSVRPVTTRAFSLLGYPIQLHAGHCPSAATGCASAAVLTTQAIYVHDDFGRKIKETAQLGKSWAYEYDVNNNLTKHTDAKGQVTGFTWQYGHQFTGRSSLLAGNLVITRNELGQPESAKTYLPGSSTDLLVEYGYTYDNLNRLDLLTDSRGGISLNHQYSPAGRLNKITDNHGNTTNYLYDAVGRLNGLWAPNYGTIGLRHDAGGRRIEKWLPNGVSSRYAYNPDGTLKQIVNRAGWSTIASQHDYLYDGFGNRKQHIEKIGAVTQTHTYTYDGLDRLLTAKNGTATQDEAYRYDPFDNLTQQSLGTPVTANTAYVYDSANQLLEVRSGTPSGALLTAHVYDANGSLTRKCEAGTVTRTATACTGDTVSQYAYDTQNRLSQVSRTGLPTESYAYDHEGRRIQKTVGATATNNLYQGPDIYAEYGSDYQSPQALYIHGPAWDDPLLRLTGSQGPTATAHYYHQDGLGSVVGLSDAGGQLTASASYDAWGKVTASSGTLPQAGYTGREPDATGLIYYRARYYDPTMRRFISRDPAGMPDGVNRYAYVRNDPVNNVDPTGLVLQGVGLPTTGGKTQTFFFDSSIANNVVNFVRDAQGAGYGITVTSDFRSIQDQAEIYKQNTARGLPAARPGKGYHETGFAVDVNVAGAATFGKLDSIARVELENIALMNNLAPIDKTRSSGFFPGVKGGTAGTVDTPRVFDPVHFQANPLSYGYNSVSEARSENQADYQQLQGLIYGNSLLNTSGASSQSLGAMTTGTSPSLYSGGATTSLRPGK
jgi:RHS repeat-associated protein